MRKKSNNKDGITIKKAIIRLKPLSKTRGANVRSLFNGFSYQGSSTDGIRLKASPSMYEKYTLWER